MVRAAAFKRSYGDRGFLKDKHPSITSETTGLARSSLARVIIKALSVMLHLFWCPIYVKSLAGRRCSLTTRHETRFGEKPKKGRVNLAEIMGWLLPWRFWHVLTPMRWSCVPWSSLDLVRVAMTGAGHGI